MLMVQLNLPPAALFLRTKELPIEATSNNSEETKNKLSGQNDILSSHIYRTMCVTQINFLLISVNQKLCPKKWCDTKSVAELVLIGSWNKNPDTILFVQVS